MSFLILLFGMMANAADKLTVEIYSVNNEEINRTETITRPPDTLKVLDRNKKIIELGANDVFCEASFYESLAVIGCSQFEGKKNRMQADSGFEISELVDCSKSEKKELSFSNKTKKSGKWAMFRLRLQCIQDKT